jgi:hypothetical protein
MRTGIPFVKIHKTDVTCIVLMCDQGPDDPCGVNAVQLSQAGALSAWSIGDDSALVCTDVTTSQICTSTSTCLVPSLQLHEHCEGNFPFLDLRCEGMVNLQAYGWANRAFSAFSSSIQIWIGCRADCLVCSRC